VTRPRIVIADDHAVFADGVRRLLEPEFEVLRLVHDGESLLDACRVLRPALALVDISMPRISGIEAAHRLLSDFPALKVVVLSMHDDLTYVLAALDEGVSGYVLKTTTGEQLLAALRTALSGGIALSPGISAEVLRARREAGRRGAVQPRRLSDKQREVLALLAEGKSAKEVAADLGLSVKTVEYHKYKAMRLLHITTSAGLVRYAVENGLAARQD
jgi:DNA-binding NarL/FixJ family response regulator